MNGVSMPHKGGWVALCLAGRPPPWPAGPLPVPFTSWPQLACTRERVKHVPICVTCLAKYMDTWMPPHGSNLRIADVNDPKKLNPAGPHQGRLIQWSRRKHTWLASQDVGCPTQTAASRSSTCGLPVCVHVMEPPWRSDQDHWESNQYHWESI